MSDALSTSHPLWICDLACAETPKCAPLKHHFDECSARVENGSKEDCVEEFFHLSHCVNNCVSNTRIRRGQCATFTSSRRGGEEGAFTEFTYLHPLMVIINNHRLFPRCGRRSSERDRNQEI